jgi:hypothetical protein
VPEGMDFNEIQNNVTLLSTKTSLPKHPFEKYTLIIAEYKIRLVRRFRCWHDRLA